jgi:hypothetical protein
MLPILKIKPPETVVWTDHPEFPVLGILAMGVALANTSAVRSNKTEMLSPNPTFRSKK